MVKNYTISEIAKIFNITTNKIRFYEKKGLLLPIREKDNEYRKFNDEDIIRLQSILLYRSIGLTIKDIKNILDNNEKENYLTHFNNQWELVNNEIHRLNGIRKSLENVIDKLYEETIEYKIDNDILDIINNSNELNNIKNNWEDKWNFNDWAKTYDRDVIEDKGELKIYKNYNLILQSVYNLVKNSKLKKPIILEIGVGTGNLSSKFLDNNFDIIGIDQSRKMLSVAKQKYPKLKVRLGEFLKIPYDNKYFDVIVSTYAFHHLNQEEKVIAIEEMLRVLKDNGIIVIGDLMFKSKDDEKDILHELSKKQVEEVKDEYYSYIDFLQNEFKKYNKKLEYKKIDKFNYVIQVK
ncbi:methyltransferase domain-containing protein [Clostridium botulinum]|uniref:MerR family transcriptional regulator n=1 Tax=Clostridium botulinum TaxID=1491 RepID=UPI00052E3F2B|nr:methyltransferase domain-containing protein [Clostridium botulinum]KGM94434.1 methyltransferase [Clostridium botulinum D str. CCUG 7971]KOC50078.1 methyltransferase [Clostridium botulinum]NFO98213.1 methyltransferase domain-containing protein [Clostridium botulinum]OOV51463.1 methyltransferase [Clostridium botulinum D/C]OOV53812.1 methyltransferase [Clostridium botulinum D/C]